MSVSWSNGVSTLFLSKAFQGIGSLSPADGNFIVGDGTNWVAEAGNTARTSLGLGTGDSPTWTNATITNLLTVQTLVSTEDLDVTDKNIIINNGGSTASTIGAGILIEGDAAAIVGYYKFDDADNGLLQMKAATGSILTVDVNANETLTIAGSLNVEADSNINQDVTTDASVTFGGITQSDGSNSVVVSDGSIEIQRTTVPFIDFKTGAAEDFDGRMQLVSDGFVWSVGGNAAPIVGLTLDSSGDLTTNNGGVGVGTSVSGTPFDFLVAGNGQVGS